MKCEQIQEKFLDFLTGELDQDSILRVQEHIKTCPGCREELEGITEIWTKLGVLPEKKPSNGLRDCFYTMLKDYKQELERKQKKRSVGEAISGWVESLRFQRPAYQFVTVLLFIIVGVAAGYFLSGGGKGSGEIARLREEVSGMRQMMAVSLMNQESPSDRLQGVSYSSQVRQPNEEMLDTLFRTLNTDPNVNVRLAAVDALYLFYGNPVVRQNLINSLSQQSSPLVQVTLIDLIVEMRERRAIEALKQLIQEEELNPDVKKKAELGIERLS